MIKVNGKNPASKFPFIGQSRTNDRVILFTEAGVGVVLCNGTEHDSQYKVGEVSTGWVMSKFPPITGEITLSNV